jgi:hypothetical protein
MEVLQRHFFTEGEIRCQVIIPIIIGRRPSGGFLVAESKLLHNQNYATRFRAAARTHFFADHSAARCPFVSLLVQSCGMKLI